MGKRERWESGSCAREKLNRGERDTGGGGMGRSSGARVVRARVGPSWARPGRAGRGGAGSRRGTKSHDMHNHES
jgi:hypothetical protein